MDNLTNEQIKQIVKDISVEEQKEHSLETEIYVITPLEYYSKILQNKKMKLSPQALFTPIIAGGVFIQKENEIVLYFNKFKKIKKINKRLFNIIYVSYHELRHAYQEQMSDFSYEVFMMHINSGDAPIPVIDYYAKHDEYYIEIDANMYALKKTKEYLMKNYPKEYESISDELSKKEKKVKLDLAKHDASDIIERYLYKLKIFLKDHNAKEIENLEEISPVLIIFLNEDLSYKNMSEIINNENFQKLDKRIIYAFLSSETFLKTLNYNELKNEELELLQESLEYQHNLYQKQANILLKEKEQSTISYLKKIKEKLSGLRTIDIFKIFNHISRVEYNDKHKENPLRTEQQRRMCIQSIPQRIEEIKEINNQRRRGYITINAFYVAGLLLSISTIIYLLLK